MLRIGPLRSEGGKQKASMERGGSGRGIARDGGVLLRQFLEARVAVQRREHWADCEVVAYSRSSGTDARQHLHGWLLFAERQIKLQQVGFRNGTDVGVAQSIERHQRFGTQSGFQQRLISQPARIQQLLVKLSVRLHQIEGFHRIFATPHLRVGEGQAERAKNEVRRELKFISSVMKCGKKSTAEGIFYGAMKQIETKTQDDPLKTFKKALENVKPALEVKSRRVGGSTYQVPVEVKPNRRTSLAIRWIINYSQARGEKTMRDKLAGELLDAANNRGNSVKKREDTHKMAEANKAFAHYRW